MLNFTVHNVKTHVRMTAEVCSGSWWGNPRERHYLEDTGIDVRIILRWIFRKLDVRALNGLMWLRTGTGGGHL